MTATQLQQLLTEADRKLKSPSAVVRELGLRLLKRAAKFLASGEAFEIEVECVCCRRWPRPWCATAFKADRLLPLCCRNCVQAWLRTGGPNEGYRVLRRDGREWTDQHVPARRAA